MADLTAFMTVTTSNDSPWLNATWQEVTKENSEESIQISKLTTILTQCDITGNPEVEPTATDLCSEMSLSDYWKLLQIIREKPSQEKNFLWLLEKSQSKLSDPTTWHGLIEKKSDLDTLLFELLLLCIKYQYLAPFKKLLTFGITKKIDVFSIKKNDCNLLDYAVIHHFTEVVELLKKEYQARGLHKHYRNFPFINNLQAAIYNGDTKKTEEQANKINDVALKTNKKILCTAAFSGELELVKALLRKVHVNHTMTTEDTIHNLANATNYVFRLGGKRDIVDFILKKLPEQIAMGIKKDLNMTDTPAPTLAPATKTSGDTAPKKTRKKPKIKKHTKTNDNAVNNSAEEAHENHHDIKLPTDETEATEQAAHEDFQRALTFFKQGKHLEANHFLSESYIKYMQTKNQLAMATIESNRIVFATTALETSGKSEEYEYTLLPIYQSAHAHYKMIDMSRLDADKKQRVTKDLSTIEEELTYLTKKYGATSFWTTKKLNQVAEPNTAQNNETLKI